MRRFDLYIGVPMNILNTRNMEIGLGGEAECSVRKEDVTNTISFEH